MSLDRSARPPASPLILAIIAVALVATACKSLPFGARPEFWGFTGPWDPRSDSSVVHHGAQLDAIVTGWVELDTLTGDIRPRYRDEFVALGGQQPRMLLVSNYVTDRFHPEPIRRLAAEPAQLTRVAGALGAAAAHAGYRGVVLDFEELSAPDLGALQRVVRVLGDSIRAHGAGPVVLAIPATDTAGYPARPLLGPADLLLVMLYDEHWSTSPPGPIASPDWVRRSLGTRVAEVGPKFLVAALPTYGYRWQPRRAALPVSYEEASRLAREKGLVLSREPATQTMRVIRDDSTQVWTADAELLRQLVQQVNGFGVRRVALWRLGLEDPRVWEILRR